MDVIVEILKAGLTVGFIVLVLLAIPTLFIVVFRFGTEIDNRLTRH